VQTTGGIDTTVDTETVDPAQAKRWHDSLAGLYAVPAPHRVADIDRAQALEMLRCGPRILDELVASGLSHSDGPQGTMFDRHDLINLALHSGSGQSMPERAVRYALRWMREDPQTWASPLEWTFDIELSCPRHEDCAGEFRHTRLMPEVNGGELRDWTCERPMRLDEHELTMLAPGRARWHGRLRTVGRLMELRSPQLRAITQDFLDAEYRWARLPKAVQADYQTVMAHGVAPCVTASLFLEREYRAAGYEARSRSGWILGMLDLVHAWVEVLDDDGTVKSVDVVFDRLSRHAEAAHPALARTALGSRVNRVLPTAADAGTVHMGHTCDDGQTTSPSVRTVIRRQGAQ
jgi:hypothetical protein